MNVVEGNHPRWILPIISAVTFTGFVDTMLLVPVIAFYAEDLGASVGITGLIIGLYSIVNTPANVLFGHLVDKVGHKLPLIFGLLGDALVMVFYSLCRLPLHLALVRLFHGIAGAMVGPATMSAITNYASADREGRVMSVYGISIAAANLVGFGIGGVLYSRLGHDWLFFFAAAMLLTGAGLGSTLPPGRRSIRVSSTASGGGLSVVKVLVRRKGLAVAYGSVFAQYFSFGGVVTLLPIYVSDIGMGAFHVGMLLTAFSVMFIVVLFPSGMLSDRIGRRLPMISGLGFGIIALGLLPVPTTFTLLLAVMAVYGLAYGLLFPSISVLVADHSHPNERGVATGIFHALLTAGVAIGAPVMGGVGEVVGVRTALMLTSIVMALALVMVVVLFSGDRS